MLNVYFTVQQMKNGFPQGSQVKMIRHRKLASKAEAFADVLNQFGDFVALSESTPFSPYVMQFSSLLGIAAAQGNTGASMMVDDKVLIVSYQEGEQCEVARRGY